MDTLVIIPVFVLIIGLWISALTAIVSAARAPGYAWHAARRSKAGTMLGILLTGGVGGLYYWIRIRGPVKAAQDRIPPPPKLDPWSTDKW